VVHQVGVLFIFLHSCTSPSARPSFKEEYVFIYISDLAHFLCTTDRFTSRLLFKKKCFNLFFRIFINMDDNIIEHYTNQSAFLIEMSEVVGGQFQVTLIEV
uniref:GRHL1/CP2 C-terminal domain-containing protein n=1 Tax=Sander lucioperca TaxID=283035 RepID=A0A8D0AMB3_SANLU